MPKWQRQRGSTANASERRPKKLVHMCRHFSLMIRAYAARAEALEAQRDLACSTDVVEEKGGKPWYEMEQD
jgi:hypothetical protein